MRDVIALEIIWKKVILLSVSTVFGILCTVQDSAISFPDDRTFSGHNMKCAILLGILKKGNKSDFVPGRCSQKNPHRFLFPWCLNTQLGASQWGPAAPHWPLIQPYPYHQWRWTHLSSRDPWVSWFQAGKTVISLVKKKESWQIIDFNAINGSDIRFEI